MSFVKKGRGGGLSRFFLHVLGREITDSIRLERVDGCDISNLLLEEGGQRGFGWVYGFLYLCITKLDFIRMRCSTPRKQLKSLSVMLVKLTFLTLVVFI